MTFEHVLDRHGLWDDVRTTPPYNDFGPRVNLGLLRMMTWTSEDEVRTFIGEASKRDLATFIGFLACVGTDVLWDARMSVLVRKWAPCFTDWDKAL